VEKQRITNSVEAYRLLRSILFTGCIQATKWEDMKGGNLHTKPSLRNACVKTCLKRTPDKSLFKHSCLLSRGILFVEWVLQVMFPSACSFIVFH
jgi:hypothetical protein